MKKRLRKKLRLREFQEMGFEVSFELDIPFTREAEFAFADKLFPFLDLQKLMIGGSLSSFFTTRVGRGSLTEIDQEAVAEWLRQQPEVSAVNIGPLVDAWYGPFE